MLRLPIRDMSYRRRHEGIAAQENYICKTLLRISIALLGLVAVLAAGGFIFLPLLVTSLAILLRALNMLYLPWQPVLPINVANKNCLIASIDDETCWHMYRFRKADLYDLLREMGMPNTFTCTNGITCPSEHALLILLY